MASARHRWPCVDGLNPRCAINTWFLRALVIFHYYLSASWAPVDKVSQRVAYPKPPHSHSSTPATVGSSCEMGAVRTVHYAQGTCRDP